jgi:hypothetical protein
LEKFAQRGSWKLSLGYYWTSTEVGANQAIRSDFAQAGAILSTGEFKDILNNVRAFRSF